MILPARGATAAAIDVRVMSGIPTLAIKGLIAIKRNFKIKIRESERKIKNYQIFMKPNVFVCLSLSIYIENVMQIIQTYKML